jgi:hypothetical protein
MTRATTTIFLAAITCLAATTPAQALPTMIRLGYSNCAACHVSPQGGGLLNDYGRTIDEAQSLRSDEYRPSENGLVKALSARGRILQDLRLVFMDQSTWTNNQPRVNAFRPRLMYRNSTTLGSGFRVSGTVIGETSAALRPSLPYDPPTSASSLIVNEALVHYRPARGLELAAGKDQLPTGINLPDLAAFTKSRNRYGYYDAPIQVKAWVGGSRYQLMPFAYAPGGNERAGDRESGVGGLAEYDVSGKGRAMLGVSLLRGNADNGDRRLIGAYARLGFGPWGILAEHDVTDRSRDSLTTPGSFRQHASFAQIFWAVREWLVASAIGERLVVAQPFVERVTAGKLELSARLTNQASIGVATRMQRNQLTGLWGTSVTLQAALKTAQ